MNGESQEIKQNKIDQLKAMTTKTIFQIRDAGIDFKTI